MAHWQIVFITYSVGVIAGAGIGGYAASKRALKAIADSLRDGVNKDGLRVLSVYLGRTASPTQARIHAPRASDVARLEQKLRAIRQHPPDAEAPAVVAPDPSCGPTTSQGRASQVPADQRDGSGNVTSP